jgi:hypothetical protein
MPGEIRDCVSGNVNNANSGNVHSALYCVRSGRDLAVLLAKCPSNGTMRVRVSSNERKLDTASKPVNTPNMGVRRISVSGLARYARSFYELLGNRRKFERTPMSGTVFVTCKGSVADTTQVASCVDISPRGMAVDCSELLTKDQVVQLHSGDHGPASRARPLLHTA